MSKSIKSGNIILNDSLDFNFIEKIADGDIKLIHNKNSICFKIGSKFYKYTTKQIIFYEIEAVKYLYNFLRRHPEYADLFIIDINQSTNVYTTFNYIESKEEQTTHKNTCKLVTMIYEYIKSRHLDIDDCSFIEYDYIQGKNLYEFSRTGDFNFDVFKQFINNFVVPMLNIQYFFFLHGRFYFDMKLDNIFLTTDGKFKLVDYEMLMKFDRVKRFDEAIWYEIPCSINEKYGIPEIQDAYLDDMIQTFNLNPFKLNIHFKKYINKEFYVVHQMFCGIFHMIVRLLEFLSYRTETMFEKFKPYITECNLRFIEYLNSEKKDLYLLIPMYDLDIFPYDLSTIDKVKYMTDNYRYI